MSTHVLVTGDIVRDCHLYGGIKTAATSFAEPGTEFLKHLGGAALSQKLLHAAADAKGVAWDRLNKEWEEAKQKRIKENATRVANGEPPLDAVVRPDKLDQSRPGVPFEDKSGLEVEDLRTVLPGHLHSYGVWTPHPAKKGAKEKVWRAEKNFGYGQTTPSNADDRAVFKKAPPPQSPPALVLVDDGGILYRHQGCREGWPDVAAGAPFVILKMSSPLCCGDLWPHLLAVAADRLLVVVSADDLRGEDSQIRRQLSWEQCASDTLLALVEDPIGRELCKAQHVVVNFSSTGALWLQRKENDDHDAQLIFDPKRIEGDFRRDFEGTVYGFQTCVATAITYRCALAKAKEEPVNDAIGEGIAAGLLARRRLIELGHGPVGGKELPGFPLDEIGQTIGAAPTGFVSVKVSKAACQSKPCRWTILTDSQRTDEPGSQVPMIGLATLTARHGRSALSHVPCLEMGKLFTVDRTEIENLRTLDRLIRAYRDGGVQKKPLCIGVFGPPGAGKSFGVKALSEAIFGEKQSKLLEFNLSQFKDPKELIGAFHSVRDEVLKGLTPVAFWDEFDAKNYEWLQYLLAPMQDGAFQEGQISHPIGKCLFIFAGGTSATLDDFGVKKPAELTPEERKHLSADDKTDQRQAEDNWREYRLKKGPDFISRLHGHLDALGPNPQNKNGCVDVTWPIRRALMLRSVLGLGPNAKLQMDDGLLYAFLSVGCYKHGSRSLEKIISALLQDRQNGRLTRSALLPDPLLERETDANQFYLRMNARNVFKNHPDIEALAAVVHKSFLQGAEAARLEAEAGKKTAAPWTLHPAIQKAYDELSEDLKISNRAAARRIPDHLALIDFTLEKRTQEDSDSWKDPLKAAIEKHIETLAQAEHLGWCAERLANGWSYSKKRNNDLKHHPLLVDWAKLSKADQDKDRVMARNIPALLDVAGYKAVPNRQSKAT